jgi:hypothetical protein
MIAAFAAGPGRGAVTIDGLRGEDEGYGPPLVQETTSNWGGGNTLASLSAVASGGFLNVFLAGSAQGNAIILFIDSRPGGQTFIPSTLITQGGEENTINNLGSSETAGLTFEDGFAADYAVRIFGNNADAFVNTYNFAARSRTYAGEAGGNNLSSGFIGDIFVDWQPVAAPDFAAHAAGAEMALSLPGLGVPTGVQTVKMVAVLVNGGSDYGSNQVLGSRTSSTSDLAGGIRQFSFEDEPGDQTLELVVDNSDSDGDGTPDPEDPDDDNDGLPDAYETNTGTYVSPTNTGSNPVNKDTDGDGHLDGAEVAGTALGFVSNPNVLNVSVMTVPGTFNTPTPWTPASGANDPSTNMLQGDTGSLAGQYQWSLDYPFSAAGVIQYKFAAGSWTHNWGAGNAPGTASPGAAANIFGTISASGLHRIAFDQVALTHTLSRRTFADAAAFLAAYGLAAGGDEDADTVANEAEFAAQTDPRNADTDGDGLTDAVETGTGTFINAGNTGTDPLRADTDNDGLADGVESNTGVFVDATNTGTNPHLADTDSDGEADEIEVFHGTSPVNAASSSMAAGRPLIDGVRDAVYGSPLAVQTVETGFGDNINEWNAAYARVAGGRLSLLFTGNLGDNFNKLHVFIDSRDGGTNAFASAGNDNSTAMNGLLFDAGFTPEYHLIVRRGFDGGAGKFDVDFADLAAGAYTSYIRVLANNVTGRGATLTGVNTQPLLVAYDGSNTAGVGGTSPGAAADQVAAAAVTTGFEISLDLADIGNPSVPLRLMLLQNNDAHTFLSNQTLAGLPLGTQNLGNPAVIDFGGLEGDQFFSTAPPESGDFRITAVEYLRPSDELRITVAGLAAGARYKVIESATLAAPFTDVAGSEFTAASPTQQITVAADTDPQNFFKVTRLP